MIRNRMRAATVRSSALLAAATLAAAGSVAAAGTAVADPAGNTPGAGGTSARLGDLGPLSGPVDVDGKRYSGGLFEMQLAGGQQIETYCIDFGTPAQKGTDYNEVAWKESKLGANKQAGRIKWILENSFPTVKAADLAKKAGVGSLTDQQAAAGTQAAIWHFSDGKNAHPFNPAANKLTDWLEKNAKDVAEPTPSLRLDPASANGKAGERLGPITVSTTAKQVKLQLDADAVKNKVAVQSADGQSVTTAKNGDKLYLKAPSSSDALKAELTASAPDVTIQDGRVFTGAKDGQASQTMILAGSKTLPQQAKADFGWAAAQSGGPIPNVSFHKDCAKGGIEVTASNKGTEDFVFSLQGKQYTVKAGGSETALVKVADKQPYKITITGPNNKTWETKGVLDCTAGTGSPSTAPSHSANGGATPAPSHSPNGGLAETGASNATPMIAGIAGACVVVGAGVLFFLRKRSRA